MSYLDSLIKERNLPSLLNGACDEESFLKRQTELRELLANHVYGTLPKKPDHMTVEITRENPSYAAGKAVYRKLVFHCESDGITFSFPAWSVIPKADKKVPAFVNISFYQASQNQYLPTEEIIDNGFAVFAFDYNDVAGDDDDFKGKIAKNLLKSRRKKNATSKISMWAWAAMRVMDYVETLDAIDLDNVAIIGHSRLGKTALWTGANDKRFKYVISNDSGCAGAALERGKIGETYKLITDRFPYWFCPEFIEKAQSGVEIPIDQHFLTALTAPRILIIGSAVLDQWADPISEFLGAKALDEAYALFGIKGLVTPDELPKARCVLDEGNVCYYIREGAHYLSRHDWNTYCDIIDKKMNANKN